jgi:cytochrome c oxidase assembly factor CtaG
LLLLLGIAVKLSRRVDDDIAAYRLATVFIVLGATLYFGPLVFAVESASQPYLAGFAQFFTSNTNVPVALGIMWVSLAGVVAVAGWLFIRTWMSATRSMAKRTTPTETTPTPKPVPTV